MVKIVEFRIPLPLNTKEFKIALPYVVSRCSVQLSSRGTGDKVEVLVNEPFDDGKLKGQYTHKIFHVSRRLPEWIKTLIPALRGATLEEKSWNAFPYLKTLYSCSLLGERFRMQVESMHLDNDNGGTTNALNLPPDLLARRQIKRINIREVDSVSGVPNPKEHIPKEVDRGPLPPNWQSLIPNSESKPESNTEPKSLSSESSPSESNLESKSKSQSETSSEKSSEKHSEKYSENSSGEDAKGGGSRRPIMCCYKVVTLNVNIWPVQEQCEEFMLRTQVEKGITEVCTRAWCWIDDYINMDQKQLQQYMQSCIIKLREIDPDRSPDKKDSKTISNLSSNSKSKASLINESEQQGIQGSESKVERIRLGQQHHTPTCRVIPSIGSLNLPKFPKVSNLKESIMEILKNPTKRFLSENLTTNPNKNTVFLRRQVPPIWMSEDSAKKCVECSRDFGMLLRKHHCRGCGRVMCHACCKRFRVLSQFQDYYGLEPQRVCKSCDVFQDKAEEEERVRAQIHSKPKSQRELQMREMIRRRAKEHGDNIRKLQILSNLPHTNMPIYIYIYVNIYI
uniref:FYVE-type domain-containing protein n=1 Tax=Amorphochlora amoebiformis TaxID=1561963 RepID=A0A7S0GUR4_9EUKA|mmetsp:Transcript_16154/g.25595  ORF Transcript_16154/g.25595 Transcript_16154/m.25595 type:complete len:565 (+) Transcript_16154:47-1741(+)